MSVAGCSVFCAVTNQRDALIVIRAVVDAGGPQMIVAAMRAHADNAVVAQYACLALSRLAREPAGKAAINAADGHMYSPLQRG